jgi:PIN domain nuclease of toxin-antitoxin system
MRVLLDTHTFLWATAEPERLGSQRAIIEDPSVDRVVSVASAWELAIKFGLGRLELPEPPASWFPSRVQQLVASVVAIDAEHALAVADLPRHHGDPFDRLLIAQARAMRVPIVTIDRAFVDYDVELLLIE